MKDSIRAALWVWKRKYLIITPFLYLVIAFTPIIDKIAFIPDLIKISDLNPQEYFGLIIKAIASILGMLMAVFLLNVQFSKEKLNNLTNPLDNDLIRNSLYNSVNLIGLSFLSYILIKNFESNAYLTVAYFISIFFLLYVYSIYPVIKSIIGKSSRIKENLKIVESLNLNSFINLSRYKRRHDFTPDLKLEEIIKENNAYILNNNISAYEKINSSIVEKGIELLGTNFNRVQCDDIFSAIINLWKTNSKTAIRVNDTHYFEMIWNSIKNIYVVFANKKVDLANAIDLHLFITLDFIKLHSKHNIAIPLSGAIDCLETSFKSNLVDNCPSQHLLHEVIRLYDKSSESSYVGYAETQWRNVIDIFRLLHDIQEAAIRMSDKELFEQSTNKIQDICADLFYTDFEIGSYQKGYIVRYMFIFSFYRSSEALKSGLYDNTLYCYRIPKTFIVNRIENQDLHIDDIKMIMKNLGDDLIEALKDEKLFVDGMYGTLKDYCSIGIRTLRHYNSNEIAETTIDYIINLLKFMKKYIEKNQLPSNSKAYLNIKSRINHFIDTTNNFEEVIIEDKVLNRWNKISNSFIEIDEEETTFNKVKWKSN